MNSQSSRVAIALTLALSLWSSAIATVAAPVQQQQTAAQTASQQPTQTQTDEPPVMPQPKPNSSPQRNQPTSAQQTSQQASAQQNNHQQNGRPLSTDEDPAMIGRRNINHGIIAHMSGSLEREVALGRQLAAEVDRQAKFIDDPVITEYVNRVGQNIVLHSDAKVPFTIKVIDSDEVNAFALPGGFIYVNKGLILAADNEAEVAVGMPPEIRHAPPPAAVENQADGVVAQNGVTVGPQFFCGLRGVHVNHGARFGA